MEINFACTALIERVVRNVAEIRYVYIVDSAQSARNAVVVIYVNIIVHAPGVENAKEANFAYTIRFNLHV